MRRRGFTVTEVVTSLAIIAMVMMASVSLLIQGTQAFANTTGSTKATNSNAQGMRYITDQLREAMSVTIPDSARIEYVYPKLMTTNDPVTGEKEWSDPMVTDGVLNRYFRLDYLTGTVKDHRTGKVLIRNIRRYDPDPKSSQYNANYQPFQLTTIGSARAVTITFITEEQMGTQKKYVRLKSTVLLRNR